eukprot:Lithocolla_globosa_v1_NODE_4018_length_1528_cov_14.174474.p2 type:complete len:123 gc:universal NODE_4018_length_1528_cov_14.174474:1259-891(-)
MAVSKRSGKIIGANRVQRYNKPTTQETMIFAQEEGQPESTLKSPSIEASESKLCPEITPQLVNKTAMYAAAKAKTKWKNQYMYLVCSSSSSASSGEEAKAELSEPAEKALRAREPMVMRKPT